MSDLIQRAQKAKKLAGDPSLPKWQRLSQAFQAVSGLVLTDISADVRERFEAELFTLRLRRHTSRQPGSPPCR